MSAFVPPDLDHLIQRYLACHAPAPMGDAPRRIEEQLGIQLPAELLKFGEVFSGGSLGTISVHSFTEGLWDNVFAATRAFRAEWTLPSNYLVLAELCESVMVLETKAPDEPSPVYLLDAAGLAELETTGCVSEPLVGFNSFAEFFQSLLDDEADA